MDSQQTNQLSTCPRVGYLAKKFANLKLPIMVCQSAAGYYIGTMGEEGPVSRESDEYFPSQAAAQKALDTNSWTQRETP
jgi:hypothetical protein